MLVEIDFEVDVEAVRTGAGGGFGSAIVDFGFFAEISQAALDSSTNEGIRAIAAWRSPCSATIRGSQSVA